jgi:hypothetical protein
MFSLGETSPAPEAAFDAVGVDRHFGGRIDPALAVRHEQPNAQRRHRDDVLRLTLRRWVGRAAFSRRSFSAGVCRAARSAAFPWVERKEVGKLS